MMEVKPTKSSGSRRFLYFSAMTANMAMLLAGIVYSWSSPSLPKLNGQVAPEENPLPYNITMTEESLITSLLTIGAVISPLMAGLSADLYGRKPTLIYSVLPIVLCFAIQAFANRLWHFYVARLLAGLGTGGVFLILPNYIAEIAEKHNRGILSCLMFACLTFGNLLSYALGPYLTIHLMSLILLAPSSLLLLIFGLFVPESPYFLVARHEEAKAAEVLSKLRSGSCNDVEFTELKCAVHESFGNKMKVTDMLTNKALMLRLGIIIGLLSFQQMAGINGVLFYMQNIFAASETSLAPENAVILVGITRFLSSLVTPAIVDSLGRKVLLHISSVGLVISLSALGAFFYLKDTGADLSAFNWVPVTSLIVYIFVYNIGIGPLPWTLLGELFPQNFKAAASTLSVMFTFLGSFGVAMTFPSFMTIVGPGRSFLILAAFSGAGVAFTHFCVPETKGKSFLEIQKMLENK